MNLHNGQLFWETTEEKELQIPRRDMDDDYDVIIIGGGMSGALSAYTLEKEGLKIAVVDKGKMGEGSTLANTGLLQFSNDIMLHELIEQIGEEDAVLFYKKCLEAVDQLEAVSETLDLPSDFIRRKSLYFASKESHIQRVKQEYEVLAQNGFSVDYWTEADIETHFPFSKPAALMMNGDAEVNPYQLNRGIIDYLNKKNVHLFENVDVRDVAETEAGVEVRTSLGRFNGKHVIFATGYDDPQLLVKNRLDLNRSYAIATAPIDDLSAWENRALIWETNRPYLYLRTTADGRIIAGGLDEDQPETAPSEEWIVNRAHQLKREVEKLFPMLDIRIAYAWGALFGESIDNLPFIGKHPSKNRIYYLLGYGGNGTVYSMLGSFLLRDLILKRPNRMAEIVKLDR
ncbi:MAG: FAD-dependent oxidoreductase [Bacillus sp. (in: firmicutes)]